MAAERRASTGAVVAAMASVYLIWGSTYFAIRVAIDTVPPLFMAGTRYLIAGLILYAVTGFGRGHREDRPTARHWRAALLSAIALLGIGNGGVTLAEEYVPSGTVALVVATVPLWIAVFGWGLFRQRLSRLASVGVVAGMVGVGLLLRPSGGGNPLALLAVVIPPLSWAAGSMYTRTAPAPRRPLVGAAMEMILGGLVLVAAAAIHGEFNQIHVDRISLASALAYIYLVVFGSIVAYSCYVWLLHVIPTQIVATYAYVNPLVAVALGTLFLGEPLSAQTLIAGTLIIAAVALILAFPPRSKGTPPKADTGPGVPDRPEPATRPPRD